MALQTYHCTNCDRDFQAGSWLCKSGEPHVVEPKRYYMTDAPAYKEDCKYSRTLVCNVLPEKQETRGNDIIRIPGVHVEFIRGMYETNNPEIQMHLDKRTNIFSGPEGLKRWEAAYLSDKERADMQQSALRSEVARLQHERNELLEQVKQKVTAAA